jgi:hypothetical protein
MCGVPETECKSKLAIHHIDYFKQNISQFNLISLCKRCHTKTNFNREHWKKFFQPFQLGLALYE